MDQKQQSSYQRDEEEDAKMPQAIDEFESGEEEEVGESYDEEEESEQFYDADEFD